MKNKTENILTILDAVRLSTEYLFKKHIESPRLISELLISYILNKNRISLYLNYEMPISDIERDKLRSYLKRVALGEPIQYILSKWDFFSITLYIDKRVLIPRPETELLVYKTLEYIINKENNYNILDIGTGSGCIIISLLKSLINSKATAIDVSEDALLLTKENSDLNNIYNISNRLNIQLCDILNQLPNSDEKFDFIVSNPPYISQKEFDLLPDNIKKYEPKIALLAADDGLIFYKRFSKIFENLLKPDGRFFLEIGYNQELDVLHIFEDSIFNIEIIKDLNNNPRVVIGRFK